LYIIITKFFLDNSVKSIAAKVQKGITFLLKFVMKNIKNVLYKIMDIIKYLIIKNLVKSYPLKQPEVFFGKNNDKTLCYYKKELFLCIYFLTIFDEKHTTVIY